MSIEAECVKHYKCGAYVKSLALEIFTQRHAVYNVKNELDSKILFYMSLTKRESYINDFLKVVNVVEKSDYIIQRHGSRSISFFHSLLLLLLYIPSWCFSLKGKSLTLYEKIVTIWALCTIYRNNRTFPHVDLEKYNMVCVHCDCVIFDSYISLLAQQNGIKTSTLQHGQFNSRKENTIVNCGLEFRAFVSDYFLCWNKFTRDEAIKSGIKEEQLPILGIVSNIGKGKVVSVNPKNNIFGVVLSHPTWESENIEMIKAANILAKSIGYKYFLKLHPRYSETYFDNIVDHEFFNGIVQKGIDILNYTNSVELSIVGSSTVFIEMLYYQHPTIRYSSLLPSDKFQDVKVGKYFTSADQIVSVYNNRSASDANDAFEYLCHSYQSGSNYANFFAQFC